jgi:hypothetical protein
MPKKPTNKLAAQEREIPLIWDIPEDLTSGYATNMLVQIGEHEFFVSFFEAQPPIIIKPQDVEKLESVRAECLARLVILPDRMEAFIEVLQKQLDIFKARKKAEAKANGSK